MVEVIRGGPRSGRIATVCARGGSKGLPGKNLRKLMGKSLVAHAVSHALESEMFEVVVVSSEDDEILAEARACGAGLVVQRPDAMATDDASKMPPIQHAVMAAEELAGHCFRTIVDLDVTSPLRSPDDIRGAVKLMEENGVSNVITGAPARKSPYFNLVELRDEGYVELCKPVVPRIERRQDSPNCYDMNAAVYVWDRDTFMTKPNVFYLDTLLYVMPEERSHDIDTPLDFELVELVMKKLALSALSPINSE